MEEIKLTQSVTEQLIRNAVDYGLAMAETATPEQTEQMIKQNELYHQGLEICPNCGRESSMELEICKFCRQDKLPF